MIGRNLEHLVQGQRYVAELQEILVSKLVLKYSQNSYVATYFSVSYDR